MLSIELYYIYIVIVILFNLYIHPLALSLGLLHLSFQSVLFRMSLPNNNSWVNFLYSATVIVCKEFSLRTRSITVLYLCILCVRIG